MLIFVSYITVNGNPLFLCIDKNTYIYVLVKTNTSYGEGKISSKIIVSSINNSRLLFQFYGMGNVLCRINAKTWHAVFVFG